MELGRDAVSQLSGAGTSQLRNTSGGLERDEIAKRKDRKTEGSHTGPDRTCVLSALKNSEGHMVTDRRGARS